ncbi:MAG: Ig-like domain-containing protein [Gemmatimonadaceae bacterium]|nr:Ig-like domain-containing protein [Gemmatimonadaceae bacterium]
MPLLSASARASSPLRRFASLGAALLLPLMPTACGSGGADSVAPPAITGVLLSTTSVPLQGVGASATVSATLQPVTSTGAISWRTDNAAVATVSGAGSSATITAVGGGSTVVTASVGGVSASATVSVTPLVRSLSVSRTTASLLVGATTAVTATVTADAEASQRVLWSSSAPTVATVDSTGLITGVAPGSATLTVTSAVNSAASATVSVAVAYPVVRSVTVTPANPSLLIAATRQLAATLDVDAGTSTAVTWVSATPAVATVSSTGLVTAVSAGTSVIRATSAANPTVSGTTTVTVTTPTVRGITLSPTAATLTTATTQQIVPTVDADPGANTQLTWSTSDAAVATVNASGVVTAVAPGGATIRATSVLVPTVSAASTVTVSGPQVINAWSRTPLAPFSLAPTIEIRDAYIASPSDGFAVFSTEAADGTMLRWDGTAWTPSVLAPFGSLTAVTGIPGRTFVGSANGQIAQFTTFATPNPGFVAMATPPIGAVFRLMSMGSTGVAALVANSGTSAPARGVLVFNGTTWTRIVDPPGMTSLLSIDVSGVNNNILVSGNGSTGLAQWNGSSWSTIPAPPVTGTLAAAAYAGSDVVVISSNFTSARWNGSAWISVTMPTTRAGAGGTFVTRLQTCGPNLYAGTTFDGRMLRLDGNAWTVIGDYGVATRGSYVITPSCGATGTLRALGADGGIGRWTGSTWELESSSPELLDVAVVSSSLAYATGGHGQVLRFNGTTWTRDLTVSTFGVLQTITATADGLVLTSEAGSPSGVWRKQGGSWSFDALSSSPWALWAASSSFALGFSVSERFVFNGTSWQASPTLTGFLPSRIDGVSPTFAMASGITSGSGAIYRWDGTTWTRMTTPPTSIAFTGLRVLSPALAFAVSGPNAYRWDGTAWTLMPASGALVGAGTLRTVAALSASDVYVVTSSGRLLRFNGTTWFTQEIFPSQPTTFVPYAAFGMVNGLGVVAGYGGTLYVGRPGAMVRQR